MLAKFDFEPPRWPILNPRRRKSKINRIAKMHLMLPFEPSTKMYLVLNIFQKKMYALRCWTFSFGKCYAEHFTKSNVMLNILQSQMWCWTFYKVKCTRCVAKMHFGIKCICNILCYKMYASNAFVTFCWCKNAFLQNKMWCIAKMHFCIKCIFAQHLCFLQSKKHSIFAQLNIFLWKMYAKMHFGIKCIFASNAFLHSIKCIFAYIFLCKMFSITFSKGKCSAPTKCKGSIKCILPLSNILVCWTFSKGKCSAKQNVRIKYIFASNAFWQSNAQALSVFIKKLEFVCKVLLCFHFIYFFLCLYYKKIYGKK